GFAQVKVAGTVHCESLRTSKTAVQRNHFSVAIDHENCVVAGKSWTGHQQVAIRIKREVERDHAFRHFGKQRHFARGRYLQNPSCSIPHIQHSTLIEGQPCWSAEILGKNGNVSLGSRFVYDSLEAARNKKIVLPVNSHGGRVRNIGKVGSDAIIGCNLENRNGRSLAALSAERHKQVAFSIKSRVVHRINTRSDPVSKNE